MLLSLPDGDDNMATDARHTLDTLDLEPVVEAQSGRQRLVIVSAQRLGQAGVDTIVEVVHNYGSRLVAGGKPSLWAVRFPGCPNTFRDDWTDPGSHHGVHVGLGEAAHSASRLAYNIGVPRN